MDVREKLVELVHNARMNALWHNAQKPDEYITDMLMEDGVTVQETEGCKYCKGEFIGENPIVTLGNDCGIDSIVEDEFLYNFCNCGTKSIVKINFCPMCGWRLS